jgi:hypothetical protein
MEDVLRSCFPSQHVRYVSSFDEAVTALRKSGYDMVVVGLTFDESHMFKLVHFVRSLDDLSELCQKLDRALSGVRADQAFNRVD